MVPAAPASLVRKIREHRCILFVGAGLSAPAGLPAWPELIRRLVARYAEEVPDDDNLADLTALAQAGQMLDVADYCKEHLGPQRFHAFLTEHVGGATAPVPDAHAVVASIPFAGVITTNFDKLLERAYPRDSSPLVVTHADRAELGLLEYNGKAYILKAHGDIDRMDSLVFTASDYRRLIHENAAFGEAFSGILRNHSVLFVGYSLSDPDFKLWLDRQMSLFRGAVPDRYALMRRSEVNKVQREVLRRTAQIQVLAFDEFDEVPAFLRQLAASVGVPAVPEPASARSGGAERPFDVGVRVPTVAAPVAAPGRATVVVVPDLFGSELLVNGDLVWFDALSIVHGGLEKLRLPDAPASTVVAGDLLGSTYDPLRVGLAERWQVESFAYDWRLPAADVAQRLAEAVLAVVGRGQACHLVAHGFGGLVVRALMRQRPELWQRLGRAVLLGTPNHGTLAAARRLSGSDPFITKLTRLDLTHDLADILAILRTFPSLFEELPFLDRSPRFAPFFESAAYGDPGVAQALLDRARQFHADLAGAVDADRMVIVAGSGQPTPIDVIGFENLRAPSAYVATAAGDGHVPLALSGLSLPSGAAVPAYAVEAAHGDLVADPAVIEALHELLAEGRTTRLRTGAAPLAVR